MSEHKSLYVTTRGIPLRFTLQFPFHPSAGGADYYVLHGDVELADGSGLYAAVAVHMSQTVKRALPTVDEHDALSPAINAIRKAADTHDIEFLRSSKRQPIHLSSRDYSLVTRRFSFHHAGEALLRRFLEWKAYWAGRYGVAAPVSDPVETQYLGCTVETLLTAANELEKAGLVRVDGGALMATDALKKRSAEIEGQCQKALEALNAKHAYERG